MTPGNQRFIQGVGTGMGVGAAVVAGGHAIRSHQKKVKNRALLARIRPHGMQGTELSSFTSLPQRIIAFARERNGDGQFAPEAAAGGPDPVAMKKAYNPALLAGSISGGKTAAVGGTSSPAAALAHALQASGFRMPQPAQEAAPALA